jgi:hypothetical protein
MKMAKRDRESLQARFLAEGKTNFVTTEAVEDSIAGVQYCHFEGTTVTVCCIELKNGFTVVGKSACANPNNFDQALGEELAYDDAKQQIFTHLAFLLCEAGNVAEG